MIAQTAFQSSKRTLFTILDTTKLILSMGSHIWKLSVVDPGFPRPLSLGQKAIIWRNFLPKTR